MIDEIEVKDATNILDLIQGMKLNTYYRMPQNFRYKWIKIEQNSDYYTKAITYCWAMEYNYKVTGGVGYIHPLTQGGNYVKQFKTEANAKRNLINRFKKYKQ